MADDEVLASPLKVHLVVLELSSPDAEQRERMILASNGNDLVLLEKLLVRLGSDPDRAAKGADATIYGQCSG